MKTFVVILCCIFLFGCDELKEIKQSKAVFKIENKTIIDSDIAIFIARLEQHPVSIFSSIEYNQKTNEIIFINGTPDDELVNYLALTIGDFYLRGEHPLDKWILQSQIETAAITVKDEERYLALSLNQRGADKMKRKTRSNMGKAMTVMLDENELASALISTTLGKRFQVPIRNKSPKELMRILTIIKTGRLNSPIKLRQVA
ncbi:hypothetical protein FLL45_18300 [Aliikangiella marina]|uniref:SecDF P1 head subdomain domain-containing protein n=1 Tax=Aliikangiella marina TaxID=1712262 RepID=A0A545T4L9_9GAMM|nr:hypothetical protein [Aliikangiella marina]TQV72171.1 hypothetical protein FLL45_18300 [Aliikangiella marina]